VIARALAIGALGVLAASAIPSLVSAAPRPPQATFFSTTLTVPADRGAVTVGLRVSRSAQCTFSATPAVPKFGAQVRCSGKTVRRVLRIGANRSSTARAFTVTVTIDGPGGRVVRRSTVHQRAKSSATGASEGGWWSPPLESAWQWELDHPLNLASASDMGLGDHTFDGSAARAPTVFDIDGFDNSPATVAALHARGDHVICYVEVGAAERFRSDYGSFAAADLGTTVSGYPTERYLNINDPAVTTVIEHRISMCAAKGFDAIEPDIDDSYTHPTGFSISEADNVRFDATLARFAHHLGLGWGLKNGDNTDGFAAHLLPSVDFELDEQCFEYGSCGTFSPSFRQAGKAVFEVEYIDDGAPSQASYCPRAIADGFNASLFDVALDARVRVPCR
jgi:hypothetical protein